MLRGAVGCAWHPYPMAYLPACDSYSLLPELLHEARHSLHDRRLQRSLSPARPPTHAATTRALQVIRSELPKLLQERGARSMVDTSCGSMLWMPLVLEEIEKSIPGFKFRGQDVSVLGGGCEWWCSAWLVGGQRWLVRWVGGGGVRGGATRHGGDGMLCSMVQCGFCLFMLLLCCRWSAG